jgi:hypothetical protein
MYKVESNIEFVGFANSKKEAIKMIEDEHGKKTIVYPCGTDIYQDTHKKSLRYRKLTKRQYEKELENL